MPTAIPFKNISIKITYVIYHYLYLIISSLKQKVWKGIATLQRLRGAISLDRTHPVLPAPAALARCRTRPLHGPLNSIALYRTRSSPRSSPLPSTGRGPLQGPLRCPLLDQALCTFSRNKKTSPSQDEALPAQQQQSIDFRRT